MTSRAATAPSDRGFVFAATSPRYTIMAQRAARNLRMVMPEAQVDLFTDQDIDDPVFDQIHKVDGWDTFNQPNDEIIKRLKGEPGTEVTIAVYRKGWQKTIDYVIAREVIDSYLDSLQGEPRGPITAKTEGVPRRVAADS